MNEVVPELQLRSEHDVSRLQTHDVNLRDDHVTLRPLTEDDWGHLLEWNNDPEVMECADHEDFKPSTLGEMQAIYRWIATHAHCFIMEVEGYAIGECWLQRTNLRRIVNQFPGKNLRRIDLMIGEKELWGRGYGTEVIDLLVNFGFSHESVDTIFGIVSADNVRSLRAFQKCGFTRHDVIQEEDGTLSYEPSSRNSRTTMGLEGPVRTGMPQRCLDAVGVYPGCLGLVLFLQSRRLRGLRQRLASLEMGADGDPRQDAQSPSDCPVILRGVRQ